MNTKSESKGDTPKKRAKLDFSSFELTQSELAELLGIMPCNVGEMAKIGTLVKQSNGRYNAKENVNKYIRNLRDKSKGQTKSELELEHIALKNEKIKEELRSWRLQRDREVGLAIIQALRSAMQRLKTECGMIPVITDAIDGLIKAIDSVDVESISYIVEGEADEDE